MPWPVRTNGWQSSSKQPALTSGFPLSRPARWANPATQALGAKGDQEGRDGTHSFVRGITHDEFWRYS